MSQTLDEEIRILRTHYWSSRDPDGRAFAPLADAYRRKGELDEAGSLVRDGLGRLPGFATGHLVAARVSRDRGDLVEARNHLDRVVDLDPQNVAALLERARLAGMEGDREQALADLRELLEIEPAHSDARSALEELEESVVRPSETPSSAGGDEGDSPAAVDAGVDPHSDSGEIDSSWDADPFDLQFGPPDSGDTDTEPEPAEAEFDISEFDPDPTGEPSEPVSEAVSGPASEPGPTSESSLSGEPEDDQSMFTRTMGEIYARQGFLDRAVEIFERLSRRDPADADLSARLEELRALAGDTGSAPSPAGPGEPVVAEEAARSPATAEGADSPRTIADYFDDLLAWVPGAVPIESLAPDAVPIESLAPDAVEIESLAPEPSEPGEPGSPPEGESPQDVDDDEDDDDFDEFQSWLESLRS